MSDIPEPKVYAPNVVGIITLVGGTRKEFTNYISYNAARAWYSNLGAILTAIVANPWGSYTPHSRKQGEVFFPATEGLAKVT